MHEIETDYLVIGAGAAGMAFVDALIAACDADVVMVDRRTAGIGDHLDDPQMQSALARLFANVEPALAKLAKFTAEISPAGGDGPAT